MDEKMQDYLFDLQGYLVLESAISDEDLRLMNQWVDDHWEYVENPWIGEGENRQGRSRWIGNIQTHTYNIENGVNFQNIIEGGEIFEKLIDHSSWINLVRKYIIRQSMGCQFTRILSPYEGSEVTSIFIVVDMSPLVI